MFDGALFKSAQKWNIIRLRYSTLQLIDRRVNKLTSSFLFSCGLLFIWLENQQCNNIGRNRGPRERTNKPYRCRISVDKYCQTFSSRWTWKCIHSSFKSRNIKGKLILFHRVCYASSKWFIFDSDARYGYDMRCDRMRLNAADNYVGTRCAYYMPSWNFDSEIITVVVRMRFFSLPPFACGFIGFTVKLWLADEPRKLNMNMQNISIFIY